MSTKPNIKNTSWWRHGLEMLSALLAFFAGNKAVTGGFLSQKGSNTELWCCFWCLFAWTNCWTNKSNGQWFKMPWCPCDVTIMNRFIYFQYKVFIQFPPMFDILRPKKNGHHLTDEIFKWIFIRENFISLFWINIILYPGGPTDQHWFRWWLWV